MELFLNEFESFVGVNFWTMIFAWCNLIILYVFLRKLLFKPVKKMIDDRQREIDDMYAGAERSEADAARLKAKYEEKLSSAEAESEDIIRTATRRAQLKEEEILRDAGVEAARIIERAEEEITLEKRRIINEAKDEVSDIALGIARAVIERDIDRAEHDKLIDDFISGMGDGND